jgi:Flp pilus assembly protein TadG
MPVFILIFCLIADASLLFNAQANLTRIVQDANRNFSIGRLADGSATEAYVSSRIGLAAGDPKTEILTTEDSGIITTSVSIPAYNFVATGLFTALLSIDLSVTAQHMKES